MRDTILRETRDEIERILGPTVNGITVDRVVVGVFFTGVQLSDGSAGICYTPVKSMPEAVCCPTSARAMPASGRLAGTAALELAEQSWAEGPMNRALGIAALNALSAACRAEMSLSDEALESGVDALDAVLIRDDDYVVVVGALAPLLRTLKSRGRPYCVLEKDPNTLKPDELPYYVPAADAPAEVPRADVLVVTGTTLLYDSLEELLALARPDAKVVVVGPTASMLGGAFFERGVDILGGVRVTDPSSLLDVLSEAGSGYHFFGRSAERYVARPVSSSAKSAKIST